MVEITNGLSENENSRMARASLMAAEQLSFARHLAMQEGALQKISPENLIALAHVIALNFNSITVATALRSTK